MDVIVQSELSEVEFVEMDPSGRYGRYNEILGKGASKTVYRAFDEYEGIEVAWNQVRLNDFMQKPEDLERLYSEIHLLKTLNHKNIMKFFTSWVDVANRNINFVTEMFTSGTLRQYRQKHRRVSIRAVKQWCRQILRGLLYLHSRDPPVIHRDLKCDNIFINGNQGEVKIGDLGLAAILRNSYAAHCVGTPEFMAPEVYEEEYNELVDIYSFGMCILELVTLEYPYSECTHPVQIYKKVISGIKPEALYKVKDPEVRDFIEKCLATVSLRLSAKELLNDPFLQIEYSESLLEEADFAPQLNNSTEFFDYYSNDRSLNFSLSIKGRMNEDDIFLGLQIADDEGRIRNIYFPFDVRTDTALNVATEMVAELDIPNQDIAKIADMIDGEISTLIPGWKSYANPNFCNHSTTNGSLVIFRSRSLGSKDLDLPQHSCSITHGRFEEISFQHEADADSNPLDSDAPQPTNLDEQSEGCGCSSSATSKAELVKLDQTHEQKQEQETASLSKDQEQETASLSKDQEQETASLSRDNSQEQEQNHDERENPEAIEKNKSMWRRRKYRKELKKLWRKQVGNISLRYSNSHSCSEKKKVKNRLSFFLNSAWSGSISRNDADHNADESCSKKTRNDKIKNGCLSSAQGMLIGRSFRTAQGMLIGRSSRSGSMRKNFGSQELIYN